MSMTMSKEEIGQKVDATMNGRRHIDSAVFRLVQAGQVTPEQVAWLGMCYLHFTMDGKRVLAKLLYNCDPLDAKSLHLLSDVIEEELTSYTCGDKSHFQMFLNFVTRYTGLSEEAAVNFPLPSGNKGLNEIRYRMAEVLPTPGYFSIAGYAGEGMIPEAFEPLTEGLRKHYGIRDEDQEAWIIHIGADKEHGKRARAVLLEYANTAERQKQILQLLDEYLDAYKAFWEGTLHPTDEFIALLREKGNQRWRIGSTAKASPVSV